MLRYCLIFYTFICSVKSVCDIPQKLIYFSLPILSNRDQLPTIFQTASKQIYQFDLVYSDLKNNKIYNFPKITTKFIYNNHNHKQEYLTNDTIRVSLGTISVFSQMNYQILDENEEELWSGVIQAKSYIDSTFFDKQINVENGYVEWRATQVNRLTFSCLWNIQKTRSFLPVDQKQQISKILNNLLTPNNLRQKIQNNLNIIYLSQLKQQLNSQLLFQSNIYQYIYNSNSYFIQHQIYNITIDQTSNGMTAYVLYGLNQTQQTCLSSLPIIPNQNQYGGVQEYISFETIKNMIKTSINKDFANLKINTSWQVPQFQFYYGDLSNAIPYASIFQSMTKISANCIAQANPLLSVFNQSTLYLQIKQKCLVFGDKNSYILSINMKLIVLVKLNADSQYLTTKISKIYPRNITIQSIDQSYVIQNPQISHFIIQSILNGTIGNPTFGHKIPLISRKYPILLLKNQYLMVYDASQYYN